MAEEKVDIVVTDRIDNSIASKLNTIASNAMKADKGIIALNASLKLINTVAADKLAQSLSKVTSASTTLFNAVKMLSGNLATLERAIQSSVGTAALLDKSLRSTVGTQEASALAARQVAGALEASTLAMRAQAAQAKQLAESLMAASAAKRTLAQSGEIGAGSPATTGVNVASAGALIGASAPMQQAAASMNMLSQSMQSNERVRAEARNSLGQYSRAAKETKAAVDQLNASVKASNSSLKTHGGFLRNEASSFAVMFRWLGAYAVFVKTVSSFDIEAKMRNMLSASMESTEGQTRKLLDVSFAIAEAARIPVEAANTSFVRFDLSLRNLGASLQESAKFTETFSKAVMISGASPHEAASALLQMSQAMNKGKLDGDEFRTMMESVPSVMDSVARTMGLVGTHGEILRGRLLQLAPQGKITADVLRRSMAGMAEEVDRKFASMQLTIGQSLTLASNRFIKWISDIQEASGVVQGLATLIEKLTRDMHLLIASLASATAAYYAFKIGSSINTNAAARVAAAAPKIAKVSSDKISLDLNKADFDMLVAKTKIAENHRAKIRLDNEQQLAKVRELAKVEAEAAKDAAIALENKIVREQRRYAQLIENSRKTHMKTFGEGAAPIQAAVDYTKIEQTAKRQEWLLNDRLEKLRIEAAMQSSVYAQRIEAATAIKNAEKLAQDQSKAAILAQKEAIDKSLERAKAQQALLTTGQAPDIGRAQRAVTFEKSRVADANKLIAEQEAIIAASKLRSAAANKDLLSASMAQSNLNGKILETEKALTAHRTTSAAAVAQARASLVTATSEEEAAKVASMTRVGMLEERAERRHAESIRKLNKAKLDASKVEAAFITENSKKLQDAGVLARDHAEMQAKAAQAVAVSQANLTASTKAYAESQRQLAIAQRGFFARTAASLGSAALSVGRFALSWGGVVTAVLAAGAAFVLFSDKIKLYDNKSGVTALDMITVALKDLREAVGDVNNPFEPIVSYFDTFGQRLLASRMELAEWRDYFESIFNGNKLIGFIAGLAVTVLSSIASMKDRVIKSLANVAIDVSKAMFDISISIINYIISSASDAIAGAGKILIDAWHKLFSIDEASAKSIANDAAKSIVNIFSIMRGIPIETTSILGNIQTGIDVENIDRTTATLTDMTSALVPASDGFKTYTRSSQELVNETIKATTATDKLTTEITQASPAWVTYQNPVTGVIGLLKQFIQYSTGAKVAATSLNTTLSDADKTMLAPAKIGVTTGPFEETHVQAELRTRREEANARLVREGSRNWAIEFEDRRTGEVLDMKRIEALEKINRKLDDQVARLGLLGDARKVQEELDRIHEGLLQKDITATEAETAAFRNKIAAVVEGTQAQAELESIYNSTIGQIQEYIRQEAALNAALNRGMLTLDDYKTRMFNLRMQKIQLNLEMGKGNWSDVALASIGKVLDGYKNMAVSIKDIMGSFNTALVDGFAKSISRMIAFNENFGDSIKDVARNALAELMQALLKVQMQALITNALGSGGSGGVGNLLGGAGGLLSGLGGLLGFASGGFTGSLPTSQVAGVVHGQEYVFDAASTAAIGVSTLDSIKSSKRVANDNTQINVSIANYGSSKSFEVEQLSANEVRIIARDEATRVVGSKTDSVVASSIKNPNSNTSKAMSSSFNTTRKRA